MISAPVAATSSGRIAFTVAAVPTGMNAGVSTTPCAVAIRPRRAAPSRASRVKEKSLISSLPQRERGRSAGIVRYELSSRLLWVKQARIAVGKKAIALRDGVGVGGLHALQPGEGGDEHEQGRARQVEVGQQQIDGAETVAGRDEQRRAAGKGRDAAALVGGALEEAHAGGADRDDAPA